MTKPLPTNSGPKSNHCYRPNRPSTGRPRTSDRAALTGIIFVLKSGIRWEMLPQEMCCGSGMSCWRRLQEWHQAGVWSQLMQRLQQRLSDGDRIEWSRACLDPQKHPRPKRGLQTGPNPTDRGKSGSKHHLLVDRQGLPLAVTLSAANVADLHQLEPRGRCAPQAPWSWPARETTGQAARGQSLRCPLVPPSLPPSLHPTADRPAWRGVFPAAGTASVGGGTHLGLAAGLPAVAHSG